MTSEELKEHSRRCYKMKQLAVFLSGFDPAYKKYIDLWHETGKRAEYRADQIILGKGDPASRPCQ